MHSSEKVIRRLYEITNDYNKGLEHQIIELIKMGLDRFDLDIGILSRIKGADYKVLYCVTPEGLDLNPGDHFDFDHTYCEITCASKGPVAIEHMGKDDKYATHPAYDAFGLESYIGVPVYFNGEVYGTLNFSSPTPYPRKFKDIDVDAMLLMVSWIEVELVRREQEKKLNQLNQDLTLLANYDSLTGILNRRGMYDELSKNINLLARSNGHGTLAMIDIDHFKVLNDTYGHQVGDDVLVQVAIKLKDSLRNYDIIARFGGEEFLVWLPELNPDGVKKLCDRIMVNIGKIAITPTPITVSIGAYKLDLNHQLNKDLEKVIYDAISEADKLLYQAKREGRNRLVSSLS